MKHQLLFATLVFTFAMTASASLNCAGNEQAPENFQPALKRAYDPWMRTLQREVSVYHYGWRTVRYPAGPPPGKFDDSVAVPSTGDPKNFTGPVELNPVVPGQAEDLTTFYFKKKAAGHLIATGSSNDFGYGLYATVEPIGSIHYSPSDNRGILLKINIPPGVRYLDMRHPGKNIPASLSDANLIWCSLYNLCTYKDCRKQFEDTWEKIQSSGRPSIDPTLLIRNLELLKKMKKVYEELQIGFVSLRWGKYQYPECQFNPELPNLGDAVFVDPDLAPKLTLSFLVPSIEASPSVEKRNAYEKVMRYFDAFELKKTATTEKYERFLDFYGAWARRLRNLPAGASVPDYQKTIYESWKDPIRRHSLLTHEIFGCSEKHPSEFQ